MKEVVSAVEALNAIDQREHTDILDATDLGDAMLETKQPGAPTGWDSQVGFGRV